MLRQCFEINKLNFSSHKENFDTDEFSKTYWIPYNKGGKRRRWYGNQDLVVDFRLKASNFTRGKLQFSKYYFNEYFSWDYLGGNNITARYFPNGFLWDVHGSGIFTDNFKLLCLLGFINSNVGKEVLTVLNPTLSFQVENLLATPVIRTLFNDDIYTCVNNCILISKSDWDAHETSWDFEENPLLCYINKEIAEGETGKSYKIESLYNLYTADWEERFMQLHANEEELNRQFIEIYGLQDELTPDVPLDEVTILQQGEISIKD